MSGAESEQKRLGISGLIYEEPLIFDRSRPGKRGVDFPELDVPAVDPAHLFPSDYLRSEPAELPEVSEPEVIRHYTRLSQWNYSIDTGFYPLGSCTMKHNPRLNEYVARIPGLSRLHPLMHDTWVQGALELMSELEDLLCEIGGLDACSLLPAAGAQGELAGLLCMRAYHGSRGEHAQRTVVLVPDSAHGTNPASATLAGLKAVQVDSGPDGILDPKTIRAHADERLAGIMITNPNTLGLFEVHIAEICEIVHEVGGLVYCDGANMNSILGLTRPGDWGVDVMHFNLHKTFSTPHGGGGPGAGPICVTKALEPFLPSPRILRRDDGSYFVDGARDASIGKLRTFFGQFLVLVRAYTYIKTLGGPGLKQVAERAVLNANYLRALLSDDYEMAFETACMHECIFSDKGLAELGVSTMDVAKRLIDYGFHPPTVYFPLIVKGALMVEPTETESKHSLDNFADAMLAIRREAEKTPELLRNAPTTAFRSRLDETRAARRPVLTVAMMDQGSKNQSV